MADPILPDDMFTVTPSDSAMITDGAGTVRTADALYITGAGNIRFVTSAGTELTIAVPANYDLKCRIKKVFATNTTATGIIAYSKTFR